MRVRPLKGTMLSTACKKRARVERGLPIGDALNRYLIGVCETDTTRPDG